MRRLLITLILLFLFSITTFAADDNFEMNVITGSRETKLRERLDVKLLSEEPSKRTISTFDVSDDGSFVLGYEDDKSTKYICVYNAESEYIYGFCYEDEGSFLVDLFDEYVNVYMIRSNLCVSVNPAGEIERLYDVPDTSYNNNYIDELQDNSRKVGNDTYKLEKRVLLILPWYSQLVCTDDNGNQRIVYAAETSEILSVVFSFTELKFVPIAVVVIVACVVYESKRKKKMKQSSDSSVIDN